MKFFQKQSRSQKIDYRVQILHVLLKNFKACRLFLIQKAVKKLRKTQKPLHENHLVFLKNLNPSELKLFSLFLMQQQKIDLSKQKEAFEKHVPGFEEKIINFSKENIEILEKFKKLKKFEQAEEEIGRILKNVKIRIEKTKVSRKILKEKHKKKKERRSEIILLLEKEQTKGEIPQIPEIEIKTEKTKNYPKNSTSIKKYQRTAKTYENITKVYQKNEKPRKFVKKTRGNEEIQDFRKIEYEIQNKDIDNKDRITTDYQIIHPSWEASIERRNQEKFSHFQGIRKKLV